MAKVCVLLSAIPSCLCYANISSSCPGHRGQVIFPIAKTSSPVCENEDVTLCCLAAPSLSQHVEEP